MTTKILHVDDDPATRYMISRVLRNAGFDVISAANGEEGLQLADLNPDLILLDVNLPDISGFEVCRRLKQNRSSSTIPILHMSATRVDTAATVAGLEGGADGYLTQPVDHAVLIATIRAFLRTRQAESEVEQAARRWQTTFDSIQDAICLTDESGKMVQSNTAFQEMTGSSDQDLKGKLIDEYLSDPLSEVPEGAETADVLFRDRWYRIAVNNVQAEGSSTGGKVYLLTDITDRREAKEDLTTSLEEKELLLQEIHHRVKNNLQVISSLLNLQTQKVNDSILQGILDECKNRIRTMALIHDYLYQIRGASGIDLAAYLKLLIDQLIRSYSMNRDVDFVFKAEPVFVDLNKAMPLGLIVNELISNSFKYAFVAGQKGTIRIALTHMESLACLSISDNGAGLPFNFEFQESAKIGLKLVRLLVAQIQGVLKFNQNQGARFEITFDLA